VADGAVNLYPGNYEDYLWRKQNGAELLEESLRAAGSGTEPAPLAAQAAAAQVPVPEAPPKRRLNPIKRRQMAERLAAVEAEVTRTEAAIAQSQEALTRFVSVEETERLTMALEDSRRALQNLEHEWVGLTEELETTE